MSVDLESYYVKIGDNKIVISSGLMRIVTLIFGFVLLRIWLGVGATLIKTGEKLD